VDNYFKIKKIKKN